MQSTFEDDEIAKRICSLLLQERKSMSLEQIEMELKDENIDRTVLSSIFSKYSKYFQLVQEPMVSLVTKIEICKTHCTKEKDCSDVFPCCSGLHICKFYFLSGECEWGKKCKFGHNLNSDHNKKVLRENLLVNVSVDDVRYLLGLTVNRTTLTVPRVCKFYNVERNKCSRSNCQDLHVCKHYITNTCCYGKDCFRSHDLKDKRNKTILRKHGIDVTKSDKKNVDQLRSILSAAKIQTSASDADMYTAASPSPRASVSNSILEKTETKLNTSDASEGDATCRSGQMESQGVKKEECTLVDSECLKKDGPELQVHIKTDLVNFLYMSELTAIENRPRTRQSNHKNYERNCLVDILVNNYNGSATVVVYCVDLNGNIHPYYLHGDNCVSGVYVRKVTLESGKNVKLQGISICKPKIADFQSTIEKTIIFLEKTGICNVKNCDQSVDRNSVNLKVTVILDDKSVLSNLTTSLQNKKVSKQMGVQKRSSDCLENNNAKKRRHMHSSDEIGGKTVKPFQRVYSRISQDDEWGNFIDTAGYQESALTWKAQGEALQSVCMICYPGGTGTGFRVGKGKNFIMTAAHVYDYILQSGRDGVGRRHYNPLKQQEVYAVFGYLKEGEVTDENKFYFKQKLHFRNDETDTVVMELEDHANGAPMPPALLYFHTLDFTKEFFFVGHSEGKPLGINRVDKIVNIESSEAQSDIIEIKEMSLKHTQCLDFPNGREYEVKPHQTLDNPHRFLFHCKFTKGASGSPGLVFLNDGRIVVVSMLLRGYPNWYYDPNTNMDDFRSRWSKDSWCVEQGVNLLSVHNIMNKEDPKLAQEIFCI